MSLARSLGLPEFALVEVELPPEISRNALLKGLSIGGHSLSILRGPSMSLSFRNKGGWEALGMRRLAIEGLDQSARVLLESLHARCKRSELFARKVA